ncbi:MAG TPA: hypothetical protein DCM86_01610 [Verrucomicrobiales bacterium]|nr:hypothetical protein [Verrucomicrobiales bacterium]
MQETLLRDHLASLEIAEAEATLHLLLTRGLPHSLHPTRLRQLAGEASGLSEWLVAESEKTAGSLAEAASLLTPPPGPGCRSHPLAHWVTRRAGELALAPLNQQARQLREQWSELDPSERCLWHQLLTGGFRSPVKTTTLARSIARLSGHRAEAIAWRMLASRVPVGELLTPAQTLDTHEVPFPEPYSPWPRGEPPPEAESPVSDWVFEWLWDPAPSQLVRGPGGVALWSAEGELLNGAHAAVMEAAARLPDGTTLQGWIDLPGEGHFLVHQVVKARGCDLVRMSGTERRGVVAALLTAATRSPMASSGQGELFMDPLATPSPPTLLATTPLTPSSWEEARGLLASAHRQGAVGLLLTRQTPLPAGHPGPAGPLAWEAPELSCMAALTSFERLPDEREDGGGSGLRWTLAARTPTGWLPVATLDPGREIPSIPELQGWIEAQISGRHGPVRTLPPGQLFEIRFKGVQHSRRHKAGLQLVAPRLARWAPSHTPGEASTVEALLQLAPPIPR